MTRPEGTRNARVLEGVLEKYGNNHPMGLMIGTIIEVYPNPDFQFTGYYPWISDSEDPEANDRQWNWRDEWLEIL